MNAVKALGYGWLRLRGPLAPDDGSRSRRGLAGGRADNAIPREAQAVLLVDGGVPPALERAAARCSSGSGLGGPARTMTRSSRLSRRGASPNTGDVQAASDRLIVDLLVALPSGVRRHGRGAPRHRPHVHEPRRRLHRGRRVVLVCAPRLVATGRPGRPARTIRSFARLAAGGRRHLEYPAWPPEFQSSLLDVVRAAYAEVYGRNPQ